MLTTIIVLAIITFIILLATKTIHLSGGLHWANWKVKTKNERQNRDIIGPDPIWGNATIVGTNQEQWLRRTKKCRHKGCDQAATAYTLVDENYAPRYR
ncbi:MAG: hypothetical protein AAB515_00700 [Patescibacteria group bacterium]